MVEAKHSQMGLSSFAYPAAQFRAATGAARE